MQHRYAWGSLFSWDSKPPNEKKTAQETMKSLQKFLPPDQKPGVVHTDNALEFVGVGEDLCWIHDKLTPYRSETTRIAENSVCMVKACTLALLVQSGLSEQCWRECFCYLRQIQDKLANKKSPSVQVNHVEQIFILIQSQRKTKWSSSIWDTSASSHVHRMRSDLWRRLET